MNKQTEKFVLQYANGFKELVEDPCSGTVPLGPRVFFVSHPFPHPGCQVNQEFMICFLKQKDCDLYCGEVTSHELFMSFYILSFIF